MFLIMATGTLAACSGFGKNQQGPAADPNVFPANYRSTLVTFLRQSLTDRSDFRDATIAEPALKPVGPSQHYVVCVQFNPRGQIKMTKVAVYQPFKELDAAAPPETLPTDLSDPRGTR